MGNYCEKMIVTDPTLYHYAQHLARKYGRGRAAFKLAKAFAGLVAPDGEHYSLSNIKRALEEV